MTNSVPFRVTVSGTNAADTEYIWNPHPSKAVVTSLTIVPNVAVAAHASNYLTVNVKKGATTIATFNTSTGSGALMAAGTPIAMSISGGGQNLELAAGTGVFEVVTAMSGTGPAYDFAVIANLQDTRL